MSVRTVRGIFIEHRGSFLPSNVSFPLWGRMLVCIGYQLYCSDACQRR